MFGVPQGSYIKLIVFEAYPIGVTKGSRPLRSVSVCSVQNIIMIRRKKPPIKKTQLTNGCALSHEKRLLFVSQQKFMNVL